MLKLNQLITDDGGADLIEYALLAGLVALACVATLTSIGTSLNALYTSISSQISKAAGP